MGEMNLNIASKRSLFIELYFNGTKLSSGTAFVASFRDRKGLITNRHNVTGRHQETEQPISTHGGVPNRLVVWHNVDKNGLTWRPIEVPLYDGDEKRWFEHPQLGPRADIVVLPLTEMPGIKLFPYDLDMAPEMLLRPADAVSVIGFPFGQGSAGLLAIWATGFIASEPDFTYNDLPVMLIDCRTRQGQSGAPVVMQRNDVYRSLSGHLMTPFTRGGKTQFVGIYSGRIRKESDLGMVWWASAVRETLEQVPSLA